jgi:2-oxoglutarate dehydrogenase E2 component (dihydrolipoamide succinyltransferase)
MKVEMMMPQMGESITEATVSRWIKKVGETVTKDEIILEISTDKVDSEIPAPSSGVLVEIKAAEGETVPVKTVIAVIDSAAEGSAQNTSLTSTAGPSEPIDSKGESRGSKVFSPVVKELAIKNDISLDELSTITGTGDQGRVTKSDLLAYIEKKSAPAVTPSPAPTPASSMSSQVPPQRSAPAPSTKDMPSIGEWGPDGTKIVPMDGMRQAIAEHMVRSKQTSPHVYSIQEVDMSAVSKWRSKYKNEFQKKEGFNLSFTCFFLEAAVAALQKFPYVNASVSDKKIILKKNINLGCAVALETTGLIVPVIKKAEEKNLVGLARSLNDLANRARKKKLLPDDVQGGTFTITNVGGLFGTVIGTPIINQPQVAILCVGAIQKKPVVVDDMIAIRERCYLTLSYDHRIIDGAIAGYFLSFVREYLEKWDMDRTPFS